MGYTKLFSELVMSTIWQEDKNTKILWVTMLAIKDRWHKVGASIPGLAKAANLTLEETQESLAKLMSPDPFSRTKDHQGIRIQEMDGGWLIINGEKYRNMMSLDERREYQRLKQRQYRSKDRLQKRVSCLQTGQQLTHTDTDTEADTDTKKNNNSQQMRDVLNSYRDEYKKRIGQPYLVNWAKDRKLLTQPLRLFGFAALLEAIPKFFENNWVKDNKAYHIGAFVKLLPGLMASEVREDYSWIDKHLAKP